MKNEFKNKKLFLLDMDGTIYNEDKLFDGVLELLEEIKKSGGRYIFITNNSSKGKADYVKKLCSLGIHANENDLYTSVDATIYTLKTKFFGKKVYVQGTNSMLIQLKDEGIAITTDVFDDIDVILVGFDTELTSEKLRNTSFLLTTRDLPYLATNPDFRCPVDFGYIPDCGSICDMLYNATEKRPTYIGKPEPTMIMNVINELGYKKEETLVVGDRLYTDIKSGINAGVDTICVLSGETCLEDIEKSEEKPTFILKSIKDML